MSETLMTGSTTPSEAAASSAPAPAAASAAPGDVGKPAAAAETADPVVDAPAEPKAGEDAPAEKPDGPEGAPASYEPFVMPEGVELDTELAGELQGIAKDLNLPQAAAQKFADLGAKMIQKMADAETAQSAQSVEEWQAATKADAEIGGAKLPANLALANKAVDAFGSPVLKELLIKSGLGNHPEIVRAFVKIGRAISEDTLDVGSGSAAPVPGDAASKLYPEQGKT